MVDRYIQIRKDMYDKIVAFCRTCALDLNISGKIKVGSFYIIYDYFNIKSREIRVK